jgi:cellulose synthase/poly-beta-1,6-N-acetylglucosamine synthase-like glycosyltransferase
MHARQRRLLRVSSTAPLVVWLAAGASAALSLLPILAAARLRSYIRSEKETQRPPFTPRVSVILPCKGLDQEFEENIRSILDEDYPDFEIVFVTATEADPACAAIRRILAEAIHVRARLVVAGFSERRSEKVNNQLRGIACAREDAEAFVFVDSDVRAGKDFLRNLVAPLQKAGVGATTGFRWYDVEGGGAAGYLQSAWNGGGLTLLADPRLAYAYGGAMAILRRTFQDIGVGARWENTLSDDMMLTQAVSAAGLTIHFVPACMTVSRERRTLAGVLEWTNRQTVVLRVYAFRKWAFIFLAHATLAVALVGGLGLMLIGLVMNRQMVWAGLLMLSVIAAECLGGLLILQAVRQVLPSTRFTPARIAFLIASAPAAMLLILHNNLHSLGTNEIQWRGTVYRITGQRTTIVRRAAGA